MIGYFTDNSISQGVMRAFAESGVEIKHIREFKNHPPNRTPIFYGMLRGTGMAMNVCKFMGYRYWYLDNGYFDATYMDENKLKDMSGTYRLVKSEMIERYPYPVRTEPRKPLKILILPPTPYSAFMHNTTPEDWLMFCKKLIEKTGDEARVRNKDDKGPFREAVRGFEAVLSFNSMAVMEAVKLGLPVYDTHGIFRNIDLFETSLPFCDFGDLQEFYKNKQFTLDQIRERKCLIN